MTPEQNCNASTPSVKKTLSPSIVKRSHVAQHSRDGCLKCKYEIPCSLCHGENEHYADEHSPRCTRSGHTCQSLLHLLQWRQPRHLRLLHRQMRQPLRLQWLQLLQLWNGTSGTSCSVGTSGPSHLTSWPDVCGLDAKRSKMTSVICVCNAFRD
jgi:hypothetical protein